MRIIIVPGNSPKNKKWAEEIKKFLQENKKHDVLSIEYSHWHSGEEIIDIEKEAARLSELLSPSEEFLIIAKSAGISVSVKAFLSGKINSKSFIFLGLPLYWAIEREIDISSMFNDFYAPALIVQNNKDPIAPASKVREFLKNLKTPKNIQLIETSGNTHEYEDFTLISSLINK